MPTWVKVSAYCLACWWESDPEEFHILATEAGPTKHFAWVHAKQKPTCKRENLRFIRKIKKEEKTDGPYKTRTAEISPADTTRENHKSNERRI